MVRNHQDGYPYLILSPFFLYTESSICLVKLIGQWILNSDGRGIARDIKKNYFHWPINFAKKRWCFCIFSKKERKNYNLCNCSFIFVRKWLNCSIKWLWKKKFKNKKIKKKKTWQRNESETNIMDILSYISSNQRPYYKNSFS